MTFLAQKQKELEKITGYLLSVATINHVDRLSEVRKAVTMIQNAFQYVVDVEAKMKKI